MPEISRFFGIVIKMHFDDHLPPHFHAEYGENKALIAITTLSIIAGNMPSRALGLIIEWASKHQDELSECWDQAQTMQILGKIPPLK